MPELPEVTAHVEGLERLLPGRTPEGIRLRSPSLLKTWDPSLAEAEGMRVVGFDRIGKRIVWALEDELFLAFHLMITGCFYWKDRGARLNRRTGLAAFDFRHGTMLLTQMASRKRRALSSPADGEPLRG